MAGWAYRKSIRISFSFCLFFRMMVSRPMACARTNSLRGTLAVASKRVSMRIAARTGHLWRQQALAVPRGVYFEVIPWMVSQHFLFDDIIY